MLENLKSLGTAGLVSGLALLSYSTPSYADVAITCATGAQSGSTGFIGCLGGSAESGLNNILFSDDKAVSGDPNGLPTVIGITDPAHGTARTAFNFTSNTDLLKVNKTTGGAATINSTTDSIINNLRYNVNPNQALFYGSTLNGFTVLDTNLQVNADSGTGNNSAGTVQFTISAVTALGQAELFTSTNLDLFGGQNKFEFTATGGEVITSVTFSSTSVNAVDVLDVKQNQVTLVKVPLTPGQQCATPPCDVTIPEPGSAVLMGGGIVGMTGMLWWYRRKDQEA